MKKRILLIIPLILLMLVSCIPLSSVAVDVTEDNAEVFAPPEEYKTESWPNASDKFWNSEHYLFAYYKDNNNHIFYLSDIDNYFDYANVEETETTITIIFDIPSGIGSPHWYDRYDWPDAFRTNQSNFDTYDSAPLIYDKINKTLTWHAATRTFDNLPVLKFETDLINSDSSPLDVTVSFSPALSGDVDRSVTWTMRDLGIEDSTVPDFMQSTQTLTSEELNMTVENNSNFGIQLFVSIVPHGESVHFLDSSSSSGSNIGVGYDESNITYVWWSNEWNYFYDSTVNLSPPADYHDIDWSSYYTCQKQYSPTPWHYFSPGEHSVHKFSFSQIDLKVGQKYDVYCFATRNDYSCSSRQYLFSDSNYYVDFSSLEVVYSSTFTLTNGYEYKPYENYGNDVVRSGSYAADAWTSFGFEDPTTGEIIMGKRELEDYNNSYYQKTGQARDDFYVSVRNERVSKKDSTDYSSILKHSNNYFSFVSEILSFFPSDLLTVYGIGFWSLLVLAIIRRLH